MKICSLSSGSKGNCVYVATDTTRILVDAGISAKRIDEELKKIGESICDIDAILVTHEHGDHIKGIGVLTRKYGFPVYGTRGTLEAALEGSNGIGAVNSKLLHFINNEQSFVIGDITVKAFSVSHDTKDPVAYTFAFKNKKIGMATDLGKYDEGIIHNLLGSDVLYIEANHDVNMLMVGRYTYNLKMRILSEHGHLSNEDCANLLVKLCNQNDRRIKEVILGHLSEENNFPELAYETVNAEFKNRLPEEIRPVLHVAPAYEHSYVAIV